MEAPSQPNQQPSVEQSKNPAFKASEERTKAQDASSTSQPPFEHRSQYNMPSTNGEEVIGSSLSHDDTGSLKERDISGPDTQNYSNEHNTEGEQMRAPSEGNIANAVMGGTGKTGGGGDQKSLVENIDAKTEAHKQALHKRGERTRAEVEEEKNEDWTGKKNNVDLGRALGGRGMAVVEAPEN